MGSQEFRNGSRCLYVNILLEMTVLEKQVWGKPEGIRRKGRRFRWVTGHLLKAQSLRTLNRSHKIGTTDQRFRRRKGKKLIHHLPTAHHWFTLRTIKTALAYLCDWGSPGVRDKAYHSGQGLKRSGLCWVCSLSHWLD